MKTSNRLITINMGGDFKLYLTKLTVYVQVLTVKVFLNFY